MSPSPPISPKLLPTRWDGLSFKHTHTHTNTRTHTHIHTHHSSSPLFSDGAGLLKLALLRPTFARGVKRLQAHHLFLMGITSCVLEVAFQFSVIIHCFVKEEEIKHALLPLSPTTANDAART
eukprot:scaffold56095_cov18-Tisochrysis_lutea.AAC.2